MLVVNISSSVGKVELSLVCNAFSEGNYKIAWVGLINKHAVHTVASLLRLKSECHNSKLDLTKKDPDEWFSNLEGLHNCMAEFGLKDKMTDEDFRILILNNKMEEYDVI